MALTSQQTRELKKLIVHRRDALIADLDQAELGRDVDELRGPEAARERIAKGDYGVCVDCGRDIGFERPGLP